MSEEITNEIKKEIPKFDFNCSSLGTMRSSGEIITLLLHLEDKDQRSSILINVAKELGIELQDLIDEYLDEICPECCMSMLLHKKNNGECF